MIGVAARDQEGMAKAGQIKKFKLFPETGNDAIQKSRSESGEKYDEISILNSSGLQGLYSRFT
jgi:hypothetical protein